MDGLTLFEALDDAATYLRNDDMVNLARAVDHAATMLGARPDEQPRPVLQVVAVGPPSLGEATTRELELARAAIRQLQHEVRAEGEPPPVWQNLADTAGDSLPIFTAENKSALAGAFDALSVIAALPSAPDHVRELVSDALAKMPRAAHMFGDGADLASAGDDG